MPKSKQRSRKKGATPQTTPTAVPQDVKKRGTLKLLRNGALGAVAVGGAGWFGVSAVRATAAEMDLTRIGQGKPVIVQVHDPQCPMCTQLQRQTRKALKCFGECDVVYLVANINGPEGRRFAAQHQVPHVTLVLFDGSGDVQGILNGVRMADELKPVFENLSASA